MIELSRYKDRPMMVVKSSKIEAGFLYEDGGKLVSLKDATDGQEFLALAPGEKYQVLAYDGSYCDAECSGFDDMFPTIDPYTPEEGLYAGKTYPDHGEICRMPMQTEIQKNSLTLKVRSNLFHILYSKTITALRDGSIEIVYRIENQNAEPFPFIWAGHCMFQGVDGARVVTSYPEDTPRVQMFGPEDIDPKDLPVDHLTGFVPETGNAYKYYYLNPMPEGTFGIAYPDGKTMHMTVDPKKVPYLGVWMNNGNFKNMYNIALEPCTAPYDAPDRSMEHGFTSVLQPGEIRIFNVRFSLN